MGAHLLAANAAHAQLVEVRTLENITEYALPNGLQVLLVPDNAKPVATVNMTYRVGSRHEGAGETGSAHLLEHMLFKASGTIKNPKNDMQAFGMRWNGTTSFDRTNYFASFLSNDSDAARRMDFMLGWLATMMTQAKFTQADLDSEMTVVRNEFERAENESGRVLGERMRAIAFSHHGYRHSVLGAKTDIENMPLDRLYGFYRKHYRPDNAALVIAGRFDVEAIKQKINAAFAPIARPTTPPPLTYTLDPVQDGERSVMLRRAGGFGNTAVLYKMPAGGTRGGIAARLLAETLSQRDGPLARSLVTSKLAATDYAAYTPTREPGFLVAGVGLLEKTEEVSDGQYALNTTRVADLLAQTIESYQPSDADVRTARSSLLAAWRFLLRDAEATGQALSEMVAMGDWRLIFGVRDALAAVTAEEVRTLASSFLVASNRTAGTYLALPGSSAVKITRAPATFTPNAGQLVSSDAALPSQKIVAAAEATNPSQGAVVKAEDFELTLAQVLARTQRAQLTVGGAPGLQLAVLPRSSKDNRVVGTLRLRWGTAQTLNSTAVLASMLATLLAEGTDKSTAAAIKERAQALDASFFFTGTTGFLNVNLEFPAENTAAALTLLDELLRSPAFKQAAFDRFQQAMLASFVGIKSAPAVLASHAIEQTFKPQSLYGAGDPREIRPFNESETLVRAATAAQLKAYWKRFGSANVGELVLLGPVNLTEVQTQLQALWGEWTTAEPHVPWIFTHASLAAQSTKFKAIPVADQANANYAGRLAVNLNGNDADYPALFLAVELLSSKALAPRIREKDGLSYSVGAALTAPLVGSAAHIDITASFAPSNLARLRAALRDVLTGRLASGFSSFEVNSAKSALVVSRVQQRASPVNTVAGMANNLRFGLPLDFVARFDAAYEQLDAAAVNAALRKYINPEQLWDAAAGSF